MGNREGGGRENGEKVGRKVEGKGWELSRFDLLLLKTYHYSPMV